MKKYTIRTKTFVEPKSRPLIVSIVINTAVILLMLVSLVSIIANGVSIGNTSPIIVAILVLRIIKSKGSPSHYELCVADIQMDTQQMVIDYHIRPPKAITVRFSEIQSVEYSDQLKCLRLVCNYTEKNGKKVIEKNGAEHLLYVEYDDNLELLRSLSALTRKEIVFVDRNEASAL